ncbi:MAG: hypothetical protein FWD53_08965, partial [Phycisphaerales bacterium]|nr:hypothetical protein [Phycisphaerales bacterium]
MIEQVLRLLSGDLGYRIGWALVHFVWQGAAVAAGLGIALHVLRSARLRYAAACVAMVALLALPVITAAMISVQANDTQLRAVNTHVAPLPAGVERTSAISAPPTESLVPTVSQVSESSGQWRKRIDACLPWGVLAWLSGVLALSVWHVSGWVFLRRVRRAG